MNQLPAVVPSVSKPSGSRLLIAPLAEVVPLSNEVGSALRTSSR